MSAVKLHPGLEDETAGVESGDGYLRPQIGIHHEGLYERCNCTGPSQLTHSLTHTPPQETKLIITTFGLFLSVRRA
jgi:hypothetical protein